MKALNIFASVAAATMLLACNENEVVNPVEPKPGQDVEFSISYKDISSRTIYGGEVNNDTGHYFPVKWLSTDQLFLMSNECNPSTGQYKVGFEGDSQPSAGTLVKIGDTGLQWSTAPTGNFYSIYPYDKADRATADPARRKVTVRMPNIQNDYVTQDVNDNLTAEPDMEAALLYAQTNGVQNGANVNLHYYNLATALRFTLQGPTTEGEEVMIREVTLIAPDGKQIAGNFDLTFADESSANANEKGVVATAPTFTPGTADGENSFDRVTIFSTYKDNGANLVLSNGQAVELNAFFLINEETNMADGGWTIQVTTLKGIYSLLISDVAVASGKNLILKPGEIHRLGDLPLLSNEKDTKWDVSTWMKNVPRNTYISEISIPGSWNSLNKNFQTIAESSPSVDDIINQYNIGVRAFHFDARWRWTESGGIFGNVNSGTFKTLGIADGTTAYKHDNDGRVMNKDAVDFAEALNTLAGQVKDDEYMMLFCTFAQDSYDNPDQPWYKAISNACDIIDNNGNIFDASTLSGTLSNVVVKDVLSHLIVVINLEGTVDASSLPANSKCFFVNAPLTLTEAMFTNENSYNRDKLYTKNGETDVTLYNTQAQISASSSNNRPSDRGFAPTMDERKMVAEGVLKWACDNYSNADYAHNAWIYLGLGGYIYTSNWLGGSSDYAMVTKTLNAWIDGKINNMKPVPDPSNGETHYYPVGVVLMNSVTSTNDYNTPDLVKNILMLNNRYLLKYDETKPAWPNDGGTTPANSPANYSASHANGGDAWTVQ